MADTESLNTCREGGGGHSRSGGSSPSTPRRSSSRNGSSQAPSSPNKSEPNSTTPAPMRQLEFNQAMSDFRHMFPSMDREIIEAVLRANNGIVDATIDQLLTMSIDNNDEEDDLPEHILFSVQRDVALESQHQNVPKSTSNRLSRIQDPAIEESPPSYTEAIKSSHVSSSHHHRHSHHRHSHHSSPACQQPGGARHHHHHNSHLSSSSANHLDLDGDDLALSNTDVKCPITSWGSVSYPSNASGCLEADFAHLSRGDNSQADGCHVQSKRSALKTCTHHHPHSSQDLIWNPESGSPPLQRPSSNQRKVSWEAPCGINSSRPFGALGDDREFWAGQMHHSYPSNRMSCSTEGFISKLPPYRNWNPPLLGTLPDDFLRLAPRVPQRIPLSTQKSDPGHRRSASSGLHRSHSNREEAGSEVPGHRRSHHVPHRSLSFAGPSTRSSHSHRISTQDINSDLIQKKMRENERRRRQASADLDPELAQYLEDERLALILQNSEFLQELRDDEDFMRTLERDRQASVMTSSAPVMILTNEESSSKSSSHGIRADEEEGYGQDHQETLEAFPFSQQLPKPSTKEDAELLQKLKHMGKASKRKFAALARRFFSRRRKKSPRHIMRESIAPSMTNLLDEEEDGNEDETSGTSSKAAGSGSSRSGFRADGHPR